MKKIIAILLSVAVLLLPLGGATALAATPPAHIPTTTASTTTAATTCDTCVEYGLLNYNSQKCAGLYGTSLADNTVFTQYSCGTAGFNFKWYLITNWNGWYQVKNVYSGKCAVPLDYSTSIGADVVQVTCVPPVSSSGACTNSCSVQLWRFEQSPYSIYGYDYLRNRFSNHCMSADSGSTLDGAHIHQTNCGSSKQADLWNRLIYQP